MRIFNVANGTEPSYEDTLIRKWWKWDTLSPRLKWLRQHGIKLDFNIDSASCVQYSVQLPEDLALEYMIRFGMEPEQI